MAEDTKPATQVATIEREISYTPLAEASEIKLTIQLVMNTLAVKTRTGKVPSVAEVVKFMMLCKTRRLNPFAADAYLIGYDTQDGPKFELITAIQALRKRAETNPQYDGCERGIIVMRGGEAIERVGTMTLPNEVLIGGWSKCYRKDYRVPFYETVKLSTYSTGKSRWGKDPEGMIIKCAEAAALRRAFPSDVGGLYVAEEFDSVERSTVKSNISDRLADLTKRPEPGTERRETVVIEQAAETPQSDASERQDADATDEPETESDAASEPDVAHAEKETKKGNQAFAEIKEMLSRAMRMEDVEGVRKIARDNAAILTQAQWNQLAMFDADQVALIQDAEENERAGK